MTTFAVRCETRRLTSGRLTSGCALYGSDVYLTYMWTAEGIPQNEGNKQMLLHSHVLISIELCISDRSDHERPQVYRRLRSRPDNLSEIIPTWHFKQQETEVIVQTKSAEAPSESSDSARQSTLRFEVNQSVIRQREKRDKESKRRSS